jgi:hypothetical protein
MRQQRAIESDQQEPAQAAHCSPASPERLGIGNEDQTWSCRGEQGFLFGPLEESRVAGMPFAI